ncbi:GTPase [Massilia sp. Dwa41.01b]|uniref:GTPase n=1 Tax=Massilia sp. Dwa41.01b TaxID=2709302 RepID=UPI00280612DE|nr:GTPase [Massilia sp. Dwa41.01b]
MDAPVKIQFALVSHTNNGKTTLARTLVGADVGEVRDAAHVTTFAEAHPLQTSAAGDTLLLWDTPGFGDSVRLLKRLALAGNPIGWFLREVFDRYRDRPFWLSQQALRAAKEEADIVLYLVNSSEAPGDAGYLPAEMNILEWLGKPVVVLLNQLGPPRPGAVESAEQQEWKSHLARFPVVREVLALDAFARCWVHEHVFYETVAPLLDPAKQPGYARLRAAWDSHNRQRYASALRMTAEQVTNAARDSEAVLEEGGGLLRGAMKAVGLGRDQQKRRGGGDGGAGRAAQWRDRQDNDAHAGAAQDRSGRGDQGQCARAREFAIKAPIDRAQAGLLGAVVSGAATGLSADLMAGGLTPGGGALLGALVGGLTAAGAAWVSTVARTATSRACSSPTLSCRPCSWARCCATWPLPTSAVGAAIM